MSMPEHPIPSPRWEPSKLHAMPCNISGFVLLKPKSPQQPLSCPLQSPSTTALAQAHPKDGEQDFIYFFFFFFQTSFDSDTWNETRCKEDFISELPDMIWVFVVGCGFLLLLFSLPITRNNLKWTQTVFVNSNKQKIFPMTQMHSIWGCFLPCSSWKEYTI